MEILRQSIICRGDISLVTMSWENTTPIPMANFDVPHQCVSWDKLQNWAKERTIVIRAPSSVSIAYYYDYEATHYLHRCRSN